MPRSVLPDSVGFAPPAILIFSLAITLTAFFALPFWPALFASLLGNTMLAISFVDFRHYIVPDMLSLPAIPFGLLATFVMSEATQPSLQVLEHLLAGAVAAGCLWAIRAGYMRYRGVEGLGLGDVKLAAVAGAWTGLHGVSLVLVLACIGALAYVALLKFKQSRQIDRMTPIPFGTFLAPAIWLVWTSQAIRQI